MGKILFITLSNIGDVILTLPALDYLRRDFPGYKITVMAGPRAAEIFQNNIYIDSFIAYDKHARAKDKIKLFARLNKEKFDAVVDLRNSLFGVCLRAKRKTSPLLRIPKHLVHMKDRHLYRALRVKKRLSLNGIPVPTAEDFKGDEAYISNILKDNNITDKGRVILIAPGARSHTKRWPREKFVQLIQALGVEFSIILVGDSGDKVITKYICENSKAKVLDLSGKTNIRQLSALIKLARLVITNDSATLHLASYLDRPVVALFGPTDETKYGPWSTNFSVVKKSLFCRPCDKAQCRFGTLECLHLIKVEDVLAKVRDILAIGHKPQAINHKDNFKRILIVRTDRIGDVVLSTPVIKALRDTYPNAYIAMMVSPATKEIVEGNPYLDSVIIYDKEARHKSWYRTFVFARNLKKKKFDLSIILHPTNRVHILTFLAGIPRRIGYSRKFGWLLTDRFAHTKELGAKHEVEYNLELLKCLGITPKDKNLFMPVSPAAEKWVKDLFLQQGIGNGDKLIAIHPGASCPSKVWPNSRFAELADRLAKSYGFKIIIVSGSKDVALADRVSKAMQQRAVNLGGRASLAQLAGILKKCRLFISNDSGPVHIASAVGTPVIAIFGRNQPGLGPKRWGPRGKKDKFLHKEAGCIQCLAHNCKKEFACLAAIRVTDVLNMVDLALEL